MQPLAGQLQRLGLARLAAAFLEVGGALNLILAQFLYVGQPMLSTWLPDEQLVALARLLEDPEAGAAFAARLRQRS